MKQLISKESRFSYSHYTLCQFQISIVEIYNTECIYDFVTKLNDVIVLHNLIHMFTY